MLFKEDKVARADAEAIRKGVGFYRWTHDLVEITGKDALEVLQKIYISDISKVAVGRSKYTASLDEAGEIIDDMIVMHMADGLYWVSDLYGPRLLPWIEQHKGGADIHAKIITYDWDMYAVQGPDSLKAMNAMLDAPVDDLKRFGICERKLGGIPVYIHRSGFTGENGYEIYSAFDKSAEVHDLALKAVASVGGRELQTLEVYVRSIPMEKGFALKQDFKHLSPYECVSAGLSPLTRTLSARKRRSHAGSTRNTAWSVWNSPANRPKTSPFGSACTGTAWRSAAARRPSTAIPWTRTLASPPSARMCQTVRS